MKGVTVIKAYKIMNDSKLGISCFDPLLKKEHSLKEKLE